MPRFSSPQVDAFRYQVVEVPLDVQATRTAEAFQFTVNDPEWAFLAEVLNQPHPELRASPASQVPFWDRVLDYNPHEHVDGFVVHPSSQKAFPREVLDWCDEVAYEFELWARARATYERWLDQLRELEAGLPTPHDWALGPPPDSALLLLEHRLQGSVPNRVAVLTRLHGLGLLAPEDGKLRDAHLRKLGCAALVRWRRASEIHRCVSRFVDGMWPSTAGTQLASPVGLEWFVDGPFQQRYLDPLHHLKFALHEHLKRPPPASASSFVVSMGGRISGAFYYELGPGEVPQLVAGGEPLPSSRARASYPRETTRAGDRIAELSARAIRAQAPRWGAYLAGLWLEQDPAHGQSWVELGVALHALGHPGQGRACVDHAIGLGLRLHTSGELAPILAPEPEALDALHRLLTRAEGWASELAGLDREEQIAVALCDDVAHNPSVRTALSGLPGLEPLLTPPEP